MIRIKMEPFSEKHLDDAALLLARRHQRDRSASPDLPGRFESPAEARMQLQNAFAGDRTSGVIAARGGRIIGFLLGSIVLPPPSAFWAGILAPRSVEMPYAGYAADTDEPAELYREMYAALAGGWAHAGCFSHFIEVHADDRPALDAWFSLGFGQYLTLASRTTEPVPPYSDPQPGLDIRRVGPGEIDVVMRLVEGLWRYHSTSPMFVPFLPESLPALRPYQLDLLSGPANAYWVAYQDGRAIGMQTFHQQTHAEMVRPDGGIYLFEGISEPDSRGSGVGTALLRESMDWARSAGHDHCTLHFFAANLSGARFWRRSGFRPLTHRLVRRIDERIAWASGDP